MLTSFSVAALSLIPFNSMNDDVLTVYTSLNSMTYVENNSAYNLIKGKESNYKPAESAFTFNEVSIGTKYKNISFSVFYRYEWFLSFSEDTMELYGTTVNGGLIDSDRTYNLALETNHIQSEGLRIGYQYNMNSVNLYAAASYLNAKKLMVGDSSGSASLTGSCGDDLKCYSGNLNLSYTYTEDELFSRDIDAPESLYGFSFDVGADWKINQHWLASVFIQDIYSEVLWDESPFTDAHATTATSVVKGGKVKIDPMITGFEGNEDYKQRLPVKYNGLIGYMDGYHAAYLQGFHSYGATLVHLGYQYQDSGSAYKIKLYPIQKAVGIEYVHSIFNVAITSDSFDYQKSSILELKLGISIALM